jgi:hypothetical protein
MGVPSSGDVGEFTYCLRPLLAIADWVSDLRIGVTVLAPARNRNNVVNFPLFDHWSAADPANPTTTLKHDQRIDALDVSAHDFRAPCALPFSPLR